MSQGTQTGALYQPRGVGRGGRWERGSKGRGHMCTYGWFMLRFDWKQQNSVKQLSFNKKNYSKRKEKNPPANAGTCVQSQENPTCQEVSKPLHRTYWAHAPEPMLHNSRSHCKKKPMHPNQRVAPTHWDQRKSMHISEDPAQPKIDKWKCENIKKKKKRIYLVGSDPPRIRSYLINLKSAYKGTAKSPHSVVYGLEPSYSSLLPTTQGEGITQECRYQG